MDSVMSRKKEAVPSGLLSKEFLSQFKTEADVSKFFKELHSQVLEQKASGFPFGLRKAFGRWQQYGQLTQRFISQEDSDRVRRGRDPDPPRPTFGVRARGGVQAPKPRIVYREVVHLALRPRTERIGYRRRAS